MSKKPSRRLHSQRFGGADDEIRAAIESAMRKNDIDVATLAENTKVARSTIKRFIERGDGINSRTIGVLMDYFDLRVEQES